MCAQGSFSWEPNVLWHTVICLSPLSAETAKNFSRLLIWQDKVIDEVINKDVLLFSGKTQTCYPGVTRCQCSIVVPFFLRHLFLVM